MLSECVVPLMELPFGTVEVVVVDDFSTDNTIQVCELLSQQYGADRLRYVQMERNSGAAAARNRGTAEATGVFIMFVDSDDVPVVAGITMLLSILEARSDLEFVYGKVVVTDNELRPKPHRHPIGSTYADIPSEVGGYHWHTMGPIYRRQLIERVGPWNTALSGSQDWEYQGRIKIAGGRGKFVDTLVGFWRQHDGERIGTSVFRPDYVKSVMLASDSILSHARYTGFCDQALEARIAKRLFIHALEWGSNGYANERNACLRQALAAISGRGFLRLALTLFTWSPPLLDGVLWPLLFKKS